MSADFKSYSAELMTRVKLRERDTFPRYLAASQTNNINIGLIDLFKPLNKNP
jgi:hypothetical protein